MKAGPYRAALCAAGIGLCLAPAFLSADVGGPVAGTVELPSVTGAAMLAQDRLLLVSAEGPVALFDRGAERLMTGRLAPKPKELLTESLKGEIAVEDLQDAASDGLGGLFLCASHARSPRGESPPERYRLARLHFDAAGGLIRARRSDGLLQAIVNGVPFLADSIRRPPARTGLNIGGLGWSPEGHLVVGLRSPTITESSPRPHGGQEDAVVLRVKNPDALFASPPSPAVLGEVIKLDLRGQGIRGICWDPARRWFWLVSGLSAAPTHPVTSPWHLWRWDGLGAPVEVRASPAFDLGTPDAVTAFSMRGQSYLMLTESGTPRSRYLVQPTTAFVDLK